MEVVLLVLLLFVYFLPTAIALMRGHANAGPIVVVNLFLGWLLIGWVVALAWSLTAQPAAAQDRPTTADPKPGAH